MTSRRMLQRAMTAILVIATAALSLVAGSAPASAEGSLAYNFKQAGSPGATHGTGFYLGVSGDGVVNPYEYGYVPMCMNNAAPGDLDSDVMCMGAATYCQSSGQGTGIALRVWRRLPGAAWDGTGVIYCPNPAQPATFLPLAQAIAGIEEQVRRALHAPTANVNPDPRGIVGIPVINWADGPTGVVTVNVTFPIPMTVYAKPGYTWTFGDGGTAYGMGNRYDGTDPLQVPGHYQVAHSYDATGSFTITVTQHWDVRIEPFALAGLTIDAPDQPSSRTVQIDELHNEIGAPR
jgi:hypothetical protein